MKPIQSTIYALALIASSLNALYATTYQEVDGFVSIEAEDYTEKTGKWLTVDSPSGKALFLVKQRGNTVRYDITFTTPGKYYLWGFGRPADPKADDWQFWWNREPVISSDNAGYQQGGRDFELNLRATHMDTTAQEWRWTRRAKDKSKQWDGWAHAIVEKPGTYSMYFQTGHEPEIATGEEAPHYESDVTKRRFGFDKFVLTLDPDWQPEGFGPPPTFQETSQ